MFKGIESLSFVNNMSQAEKDRQDQDEIKQSKKTEQLGSQTDGKVQDVETLVFDNTKASSNDVPIKFLASDVLLSDVIEVVNELIKRDARSKKV